MTEKDKPSVLRETDDEARRLARVLLRSARSCALAVLEPETGTPFASRTLTGTDTDGTPVILVSALSVHTQALRADPRASLLAGEPGKGDPLAHPRLTVICAAEEIARGSDAHAGLRERFVRRHPKAKLYVDFPDFAFFRLVPSRVRVIWDVSLVRRDEMTCVFRDHIRVEHRSRLLWGLSQLALVNWIVQRHDDEETPLFARNLVEVCSRRVAARDA